VAQGRGLYPNCFDKSRNRREKIEVLNVDELSWCDKPQLLVNLDGNLSALLVLALRFTNIALSEVHIFFLLFLYRRTQ
jgi:hypothetical protein